MPAISEIINQAILENDREINEMRKRVPHLTDITREQFLQLLNIECTTLIKRNSIEKSFIVDSKNEAVVNHLFLYLQDSPDFRGNPYRGIMMFGEIGSGKTVLLRGFCNLYKRLFQREVTFMPAIMLSRSLINGKGEEFYKRPFLIDDLGKEEDIVNNYGTKIRPIMDFLAVRYDFGTLTFATTNYSLTTLAGKYGEQTLDRMKEMFNFVELKGNSRR